MAGKLAAMPTKPLPTKKGLQVGNKRIPPANNEDSASSSSFQIEEPERHSVQPSAAKGTAIIVALGGVSFINTLGSGILTIALPRMAKDLNLAQDLLLWPASVYALAAGCLLLLFGNLGDLYGAKRVWLTGSVLFMIITIACGVSRTAIQLITFRTLLGVAIAMCLPTAVSLVTSSFAPGRWRNMAFACIGMGQPLGYSVGLVLGGVLTDTIGWRYGYYISAIINAPLCATAIWALPPAAPTKTPRGIALLKEVDWVGTILLSTSLGLLTYVLARISQSYTAFDQAVTIVLFAISIVLFPAFFFWTSYQEKHKRPAIIPNSLWKNIVFSTVCAVVFFCWGAFNAFQYFTSLYFQLVQHNTALQTSVRFLPMVIVGAVTNIFTGFMVDRLSVRTLVVASAVLTTASPLILAFGDVYNNYWLGPFFAVTLSPLHPDVLFTVSNLIISDAYPGESQSLAGAVFNTVSQLGNSVGLAVPAAIAASVTAHNPSGSLEAGYKAAYWMMFAAMLVVVVVSWFGLRKAGKAG